MSILSTQYDSGQFFDEMFVPGAEVRPHYRRLAERLGTIPENDFNQRRAAVDLAFLRQGVTFTVYSDSQGTERIFPFDLIPRVIPSAEWKRIELGLLQRLMALNNFALIAGISPQEIEEWFHAVFIDAYDWVMQTNVIGMGQFADGGILASKPYAASANYINKMSDYCGSCVYNHQDRTGEKACPFNFFYWDFLARHQDKLKSQGRMSLILANLARISTEELKKIRQKAAEWHAKISSSM